MRRLGFAVALLALCAVGWSGRPKGIAPSPLVSRGKRVVSSEAAASNPGGVNDGVYRAFGGAWRAGRPSAERPAWVAIDVGAGPRRLVVHWTASFSYNYEETVYGSPGSYRVETSADSTDGERGVWRTAVRVPDVSVRTAMHVLEFTGQRWVRVVVTGTPAISPNGVQIDEIDVHDVTAGAEDTWFFLGDSITALAFDRASPAHQPSFAALIAARHPSQFPIMLNGGNGGEKVGDGARRISALLADNRDIRFWAIGYGSNDAAGGDGELPRFRTELRAIVERALAAGRVPIVARIPWAGDGRHASVPAFNDAIDELVAEKRLLRGPDLYAWFALHQDELSDGLHPNDRGILSVNRLWADAVESLYAR